MHNNMETLRKNKSNHLRTDDESTNIFQYKNGSHQVHQSDYLETMVSDKATLGKDPTVQYQNIP